jgi:hypothetical protein
MSETDLTMSAESAFAGKTVLYGVGGVASLDLEGRSREQLRHM